MEPAVRALGYVLDEYSIGLSGTTVAVVGQGRLVGGPIARWLRDQGAQVSVIDITTPEPASVAARCDLVVTGVGRPGLITGEWIKDGATVVDFGYGKKGDAFAGDVDFESVAKKAGLITPVPGGMGPLVIAAVLENVVELAALGQQ